MFEVDFLIEIFEIANLCADLKRINDYDIVSEYVELIDIIKYNTSVEQWTKSTIEKSDRK